MKIGPKLLLSVQPSGILLVLDRDSALQGSELSTAWLFKRTNVSAAQQPNNSGKVDNIVDDVEICSWETIILHSCESRQSKNLCM